ncbi:MAG: cellulase family glycosylhydrolase [Lachnospiraceae bacterium]|nr:cellulase family glycosylhydrolase [Lachnospiraceae bacterium]
MNSNNGWKTAFIVLVSVVVLAAVAIIAFVAGYISNQKAEQPSKAPVETTTAVATQPQETTKAAEKETATTETSKEDESRGEALAVEAMDGLEVEFLEGNTWGEAPEIYMQVDVTLKNTTDQEVSNWAIEIPVKEGTTFVNGWNANYEIVDNVLYITETYGTPIPANSEYGNKPGFQICYNEAPEYEKAVVGVGKVSESVEQESKDSKTDGDTSTKSNKVDSKEDVKVAEGTYYGALQVDGRNLVNSKGETVQLKGVSTHSLTWYPQYVNQESFQSLKELGANTIRLAMYTGEGGYCTGANQSELKKLVDDGVKYTKNLNMYCIIDWHILSDNDPNTYKEEAKAFFKEVSAKYKDEEHVIYEICNEPNGGTSWASVKSYAEEIIPVIRANDKDAVILVGTPTWSQDVDQAAKDPITVDDNVMYVLHFYAATHKDDLRNKMVKALESGLPIFISEFSTCDASGNGTVDTASGDAWLEVINQYHISYVGWNLSNKNESSAILKSSVTKTSGYTQSDLTQTGLWLIKAFASN